MLFNSLRFALFFPVVYLIYLRLPHRQQNLFLLAASYFFYGSWNWRFLSLLALSTIVDFYCGARIHALSGPKRKRYLIVSLVTNLGILGVFKYFNFFADSLRDLLMSLGLHVDPVTLNIVLPVGISFYTFQTLSYTIDIYRGTLEPEKSFVDFALFVAFFPQLVAGPIERAARFLPQIRQPRRITREYMSRGLWFVFWGYFLKTFVADNLAPISNRVFGGSGPVDGVTALIGVYAFAFQIFGDFAGYSSIAIGVALLMGFELSTNFLFPYFVTNPREFWRNWHISLSAWLRDYLFIPLGGSRGSTFRVYRNLFLTMLLGGLWHGAAWTFVLWGAFHGALLTSHRALQRWFSTGPESPLRERWTAGWVVKVFLMFHVTCVGWMIFRAPSIRRLTEMGTGILTNLHVPSERDMYNALQLAFFAGLLISVQVLQLRGGGAVDLSRFSAWMRIAVVTLMLYSLLIWGSYRGSPFIYFQF
jgi:alginate O-acetyltransferase complex protein AlgI